MTARREKRRTTVGAARLVWVVDFVFQHADGRAERVHRTSPVQNRRGAEAYERQIREAMLAKPCGKSTVTTQDLTFKAFSDEFMSNYVKVNNKPSEAHTKATILRVHLLPAFGNQLLASIGTRDVERYKRRKLDRGYLPKSINNHLGVLSKALRTAVEWELLKVAPVIRPLKVMKSKIRFLDFEEARIFVEALESEWRNMAIFALNTGLRQGELLALRWANVDLENSQAFVCENDWRGVIGTPKGGLSRTVPLNQAALLALRNQGQGRGRLVFCHDDGSRIDYHQCRDPLRRACWKAGIREIQWHGLRHTFASHLAIRGVPMKTIQDLLGHTTMAMTLRYAHGTPESGRAGVAVLDWAGAERAHILHNGVLSSKKDNDIS